MPPLYVREPFRFGAVKPATGTDTPLRNGVALTDDPDWHLRDKIIAVLFTSPGERVNAPRFGAGLNRAVFEGLSPLTVTAIEYRVAEGLRRDVGDEIIVDGIDISTEPVAGELLLVITYRRREDRIARTLRIEL